MAERMRRDCSVLCKQHWSEKAQKLKHSKQEQRRQTMCNWLEQFFNWASVIILNHNETLVSDNQ